MGADPWRAWDRLAILGPQEVRHGLTGVILCGYVLVHLYGNLMLYGGASAING
jgi:hypothetical protein